MLEHSRRNANAKVEHGADPVAGSSGGLACGPLRFRKQLHKLPGVGVGSRTLGGRNTSVLPGHQLIETPPIGMGHYGRRNLLAVFQVLVAPRLAPAIALHHLPRIEEDMSRVEDLKVMSRDGRLNTLRSKSSVFHRRLLSDQTERSSFRSKEVDSGRVRPTERYEFRDAVSRIAGNFASFVRSMRASRVKESPDASHDSEQ